MAGPRGIICIRVFILAITLPTVINWVLVYSILVQFYFFVEMKILSEGLYGSFYAVVCFSGSNFLYMPYKRTQLGQYT